MQTKDIRFVWNKYFMHIRNYLLIEEDEYFPLFTKSLEKRRQQLLKEDATNDSLRLFLLEFDPEKLYYSLYNEKDDRIFLNHDNFKKFSQAILKWEKLDYEFRDYLILFGRYLSICKTLNKSIEHSATADRVVMELNELFSITTNAYSFISKLNYTYKMTIFFSLITAILFIYTFFFNSIPVKHISDSDSAVKLASIKSMVDEEVERQLNLKISSQKEFDDIPKMKDDEKDDDLSSPVTNAKTIFQPEEKYIKPTIPYEHQEQSKDYNEPSISYEQHIEEPNQENEVENFKSAQSGLDKNLLKSLIKEQLESQLQDLYSIQKDFNKKEIKKLELLNKELKGIKHNELQFKK